MFHSHVDCLQKPPLGSKPNTKLGDHSTLNAHNHWFILFHHVWEPEWIEIQWNVIWLRGLVTYNFTLHWRIADHTMWFGRCFGMTFGHFFWALPISCSRILARVSSGPKCYRSTIAGSSKKILKNIKHKKYKICEDIIMKKNSFCNILLLLSYLRSFLLIFC
jgi:hypothetical protein